jgi:glycerol-3-phosphate dehydrogenase
LFNESKGVFTLEKKYDVAIIGGGVRDSNCSLAFKISISVVLIEKVEGCRFWHIESQCGIVIGGYDSPLALRAERILSTMFDQASEELKFDFKRTGSFVSAFNEEELKSCYMEKKQGDERGLKGEVITDIKRIKTMEPRISDKVVGVYYCPTAGITWPFGLCIALAENAYQNGVHFLLNSPVTAIAKKTDSFMIKAGSHEIEASYVINAAGLYADKIANMVGLYDFTITPRKGEYILLDKKALELSIVLFPVPTKFSKGILVAPTTHGNTYIGPNSNLQEDKEDTATTSAGLNEIIDGARKIFPSIPLRSAITNFAGLRAISSRDGDFIIEHSKVHGFVNAAGICSPGLSSCLAIAERIVEILRNDVGVKLIENPKYEPRRIPPRRLEHMKESELQAAIKENPLWGRVICRCETVTEAEIVDAIHRPLGATSLDMIKKRLRPGMGRCQGAFCTPKLLKILSRELKIPIERIPKNVYGTELIVGRTKGLESKYWEGDP